MHLCLPPCPRHIKSGGRARAPLCPMVSAPMATGMRLGPPQPDSWHRPAEVASMSVCVCIFKPSLLFIFVFKFCLWLLGSSSPDPHLGSAPGPRWRTSVSQISWRFVPPYVNPGYAPGRVGTFQLDDHRWNSQTVTCTSSSLRSGTRVAILNTDFKYVWLLHNDVTQLRLDLATYWFGGSSYARVARRRSFQNVAECRFVVPRKQFPLFFMKGYADIELANHLLYFVQSMFVRRLWKLTLDSQCSLRKSRRNSLKHSPVGSVCLQACIYNNTDLHCLRQTTTDLLA